MGGDSSTTQFLGSGLTTGVSTERAFLDRIRRAFDLMRFRTAAADELIADDGAFYSAVGIVALAGVAAAAGSGAWIVGYVGSAISYLVLSFLLAGAVHLGATLALGAKGDFVALYRGLGHTYLVLWIAGIPIVQAFFIWALWIWALAGVVLVAERCYRLERVQAVAVAGIPAAVGLFVAILFNGVLALATLLVGWLF